MIRRSWARIALHVGSAAAVFGLSKYHAAVVAEPPYDFTDSFRFSAAIAFLGLLALGAYAAGLPDRRAGRGGALLASLVATGSSAIGVSLIQFVGGTTVLPRFVVFGSIAVLVPWFVLCARLGGDLDDRARATDRVVVVGQLSDVGALMIDIDDHAERPATVVQIVPPEQARATHRSRPLVDLVTASAATVLVLDSVALGEPSVVRQASQVHVSGVRVRSLLDFYEEWLGKLPVAELERASLLFDIAEVHGSAYAPLKRLVDVVVGSAMMAVLLLVTPIVLVGNLFGNRGPLWFRQTRVGKGGVPIEILKFRTMVTGGPTTWTTVDDRRVTPFGRFLRRSHLDELPQAVNILRGDLAVVGPRPEQPAYVEELTAKLPFYRLRHVVRPGVTGWAQVKYGYAATNLDALEKLQYEVYYLRHQRLRFDLQIIVRTIRAVVGGQGSGR